MLKKKLSIVFVVLLFLSIVFVIEPHDKLYRVTEVLSPSSFELDSEKFVIKDLSTFDSKFTERNKVLSKNLGITENEAFILGNLAKYWASDLMKGRTVYKKSDDLIYFKYSYKTKFMHSGYCLIDSKPYSQKAFEKRLSSVRNTKYKVMDIVSGDVFDIADSRVKTLKEFIIIRKNHVPKESKTLQIPAWNKQKIEQGDLKIYFADFTTNLKPDRSCSSAICKEILNNINGAKKTIDMAIYGYSRTPEIETALEKAVNRGVKIRLVYDLDSKGSNIYPDTKVITNLVPDNKNDGCSEEYANIMHNKFYIFDDETLITGSANLSRTDMSGFNTNSIVVLKSKEAARIYKQEFEQMYSGKFHNQKVSAHNKNLILSEVPVKIYFSPQDKAVSNCVIPLIKNAKKYIISK